MRTFTVRFNIRLPLTRILGMQLKIEVTRTRIHRVCRQGVELGLQVGLRLGVAVHTHIQFTSTEYIRAPIPTCYPNNWFSRCYTLPPCNPYDPLFSCYFPPTYGVYQSTTTTVLTTLTSTSIVQVTIPHGAANPDSTGYSPSTITVEIGVNNTVRWVNNDTAPHTVIATDHSFDSGNLNPGDAWTYTFTKPGTYNYICTHHPWMKGTVIVLST